MKKLNITKKQFTESEYLQRKYGRLAYVSESGRIYKTSKGQMIKFKESSDAEEAYKLKELADNHLDAISKAYDEVSKFYDDFEDAFSNSHPILSSSL